MRGGAIRLRTSVLWALGAILLLVFQAAMPTALTAQALQESSYFDSYYVVAHLHYTLSLVAVLAVFAGCYYWFEKAWGSRYSAKLGAAHFWVTIAGVALLFAPQALLALRGPPPRFEDYPRTFATLNAVSTAGYGLTVLGLGVFLTLLLVALRRRLTPAKAVRAGGA